MGAGDQVATVHAALVRRRCGQAGQLQRVDIAGFEPTSARPVHPAGDHIEHVAQPLSDRAGHMQGNARASDHHRAGCGREIPCHPLDHRTRDLAARGQVVEVGIRHEIAQGVHPRRQILAVGGVLEPFVEDHLDHGQQQRPVLSRPHRQVHIRLVRGFGSHRVHHDDRGALPLALQCSFPARGHRFQPVPGADRRVRADQQEVVAVVDVGHRRHQDRSVHRFGDDVHCVLVDRPDGITVLSSDGVQPRDHEQHVR